jgi:hypothetical protein
MMSKMKSQMENPYEPSGTPSSPPESIIDAPPSPKSILLAFLVGAGGGVLPVYFVFLSWNRWVLPLFVLPIFGEYGFILFVAYFPLFGLVSSRLRLPLLYCYWGLVLVCVCGTIPWMMGKFFPLNAIIMLGYTLNWWVGALITLILTGRLRSKPS